jgi:hypothetical protein
MTNDERTTDEHAMQASYCLVIDERDDRAATSAVRREVPATGHGT